MNGSAPREINGKLGVFIGETKAQLREHADKIEALQETCATMSDKVERKIGALDEKFDERTEKLVQEIRANQMTLAKWGGAMGAGLAFLMLARDLIVAFLKNGG